ncbi:MAG: glycoside hydrolase family 125 protein [Bacteroidetes bacterium]|nr:glycoside hydrolase family 125 protein [Bacteroidota bacterium]
MTHRRHFIRSTSLAAIAIAGGIPSFSFASPVDFVSRRPEPGKRRFSSKAVEDTIAKVKKSMADEELAWMFENCFPNTLDTTVTYSEKNGQPSTYVITGDIDAMWLRDSSAQVWPYLPLAKSDKELQQLLKGVIAKQVSFVLLDPYANAFYDDPGKVSEWKNDITEMKPGVHERKWEIDSLCYVIRLSAGYYNHTGDTSIFTPEWQQAMTLIVQTFREQQRIHDHGPYRFQRNAANPTDTQFSGGYGNPTKKIGLIHSMFRPSDDATVYPFLISSNMFAVVSLKQLASMFALIPGYEIMRAECNRFASELDKVLKQHAVLQHPVCGSLFPLEIDGFGNALFMDDANVPNILSLPYLGYCSTSDPVYINSRKFSLSHNNPWFHEGKFAKGIGGPHVGENKIWPMGLIMQALTSNDEKEIVYCLKTIKRTHAGTGFIHESFHVDDPADFSRSWFAWANTLFGELILHLYNKKPALLQNRF